MSARHVEEQVTPTTYVSTFSTQFFKRKSVVGLIKSESWPLHDVMAVSVNVSDHPDMCPMKRSPVLPLY